MILNDIVLNTRAGELLVDSESIEGGLGYNALYINVIPKNSKHPEVPETVICVRDTEDGELELCVWDDPNTEDYTHVFRYKNPHVQGVANG